MSAHETMKEQVMALFASTPNGRLRPRDVEKGVGGPFRGSSSLFADVLKDLIDEGRLVYTYRDPCSFIEVPCTDDDGNSVLRPR